MHLFRTEIPTNRSQRFRSNRDGVANAVPKHSDDAEADPTSEEVAVTAETAEGEAGGIKVAGQAGAAVDSVVEGVPANKKTVAPVVENCTECSKELPGEFFACKTCPGEFVTNLTIHSLTDIYSTEFSKPIVILCGECAFKPQLTNACAEHTFIEHFLILIRNRNAWYIQGEPEPETESKSESDEDEPTIKSLQAQINQLFELIQGRMPLAAQPAPE